METEIDTSFTTRTVQTIQRWEYKARNLDKVPGMALENDFNKFGQDGWELVCVAKDYAVFKRPL